MGNHTNKNVPIEQRKLNEVWDNAPKNIKIKNPAFEFVPKKYIKAIISEFKDLLCKFQYHYKDSVFQKDVYYNHPCKNFTETDEALRTRFIRRIKEKNDTKTKLTFKGAKLFTTGKIREEYEVNIEDIEVMDRILISLDFSQIVTVEKEREFWQSNDKKITLTIDKVKGLGTFVELERTTKNKNEAKTLISQLIKVGMQLGLKNQIRTSYLEMILEKKAEKAK